MRESFPSHGSNPSKASPFQAPDPRLDENRCLTERIVIPSGHLAIPGCGLPYPCSCGQRFRVHQATGVACLLQFPERSGSTTLSRHSRPDRRQRIRFITNRPWLLRPSQCCPCSPCLAVGPATTRVAPRPAAFPCSAFITGGFRSALYTGSPSSSRRNDVKHPDSTAYLLVQAYQPHLACCLLTMLASVHFVLTMSSDSNSTPD